MEAFWNLVNWEFAAKNSLPDPSKRSRISGLSSAGGPPLFSLPGNGHHQAAPGQQK
jgi:hypothetical protein